jgi:hypothetical protein
MSVTRKKKKEEKNPTVKKEIDSQMSKHHSNTNLK